MDWDLWRVGRSIKRQCDIQKLSCLEENDTGLGVDIAVRDILEEGRFERLRHRLPAY